LRLSLAFGVWAVALLTARLSGAIVCWLWLAGLAVACAIWLPGAAPYFLFPSLVAAPLLLVTVRGGRETALFFAALAALVIWIGFAAIGEQLMGLALHEMFMVSAAVGLVTVLPLLRKARGFGMACAFSLLAALLLAVVAGLQPAYSSNAPERLNLHYVERDSKAWWVADAVRRLPDDLRKAAPFSATPQDHPVRGYVAPAGPAHLLPPRIVATRNGDDVTLALDATVDALSLRLPQEAGLKSLTIAGLEAPAAGDVETINCATPDCGQMRLTLHMASAAPFALQLRAVRRGLPQQGAALEKARPPEAVPSQGGDTILLVKDIAVP
jgi:hypothetical protein